MIRYNLFIMLDYTGYNQQQVKYYIILYNNKSLLALLQKFN